MSALSSCLGKENDSGVSDICSRTSSHLWSSVWNLYTLHTWAHSTAHTHTQRWYHKHVFLPKSSFPAEQHCDGVCVSPALIIGLFSLSWKELWRLSHSAGHWGQEDEYSRWDLKEIRLYLPLLHLILPPHPSSQCVLWSRAEGNSLLLVSPCVQEVFCPRSLPPPADGTPSPPRPRSLRPSSWWEEWKKRRITCDVWKHKHVWMLRKSFTFSRTINPPDFDW